MVTSEAVSGTTAGAGGSGEVGLEDEEPPPPQETQSTTAAQMNSISPGRQNRYCLRVVLVILLLVFVLILVFMIQVF
jgi:hypothetical protein